MRVKKRNGSRQAFCIDKIVNAITKANKSVQQNEQISDEEISRIANIVQENLSGSKTVNVEDIQNQVELTLMMEQHYSVAKSYILYRQKRAEDREILEKMCFLTNYVNASNAATGSKFDANANVEKKNIATLMGELPKQSFIQINRRLLTDRIKEKYGEDLAEKYIDMLENHFIYKNDETSLANYCASITMYPWLLDGTKPIGGSSTAPTKLKSFCGGFINLVFMVSSQLSGACATPEFLMYMDYFIRKDYGDNYYERIDDIVDLSNTPRSIDKVITDYFQQIVYSLNQPAGSRNFQSVFWNIAYYDRYYFESLFGEFHFPDGTQPIWESLSWLQKRFMRWFNAERTKSVLTFPVETMALLTENGDVKDKEYGDFTAEMYAEGHSFFTYMSDSADSLSSCCFDKDQKVLWKSSSYGVQLTTLKELYDLKWEPYKKNLKIYHNGSWINGKPISLPNRKMYKIVTENNKEFCVTDNHINVTLNGEKTTEELTTEDYLMFNTMVLDSVPENDEHLTYAQGFVIGAFLGDGSFGTRHEDGTIYEVNFSQNEKKYKRCEEMVNLANAQLGGESICGLNSVYNNVYPLRISSRKLVAFIQKWTNWKEGTLYFNKELNLDCLLQTVEFRKGILDGWYNTDGGNSNRCYTTSVKLVECMEALATSLGLQTIVDCSDRTDEIVVIRDNEYNRNYPLYCLRWYSNGNNRKNKDKNHIWIKKNNSIYFKIKSIEEVEYKDNVYCIECKNEDEPYFTLPCGLITHNCRLRNQLKDNGFSYTLGAGGVSTGSKSVLSINLNRCIQYAVKNNIPYLEYLEDVVDLCHKVQIAYNENLKELQKKGMLSLFDSGLIALSRQYLTIGINGLVEAAEFLKIDISDNSEYEKFVQDVLGLIENYNQKYYSKKDGLMFNCEMIPAENVGVKHAKWDKEDGYVVPRDCYNSYFYIVEDPNTNVLDKFRLHGEKYIKHLTGGSALHCNLEEHLSKEQYRQLLRVAAREGCNYFTFNIPNTICNDCGHIDKRYLKECPECHSHNVDYLTRIIGYLKRISNFSEARQKEAGRRFYGTLEKE